MSRRLGRLIFTMALVFGMTLVARGYAAESSSGEAIRLHPHATAAEVEAFWNAAFERAVIAECSANAASTSTSMSTSVPVDPFHGAAARARTCGGCSDCLSASSCDGKASGSSCTVGSRTGVCTTIETCGFFGTCACCSCA